MFISPANSKSFEFGTIRWNGVALNKYPFNSHSSHFNSDEELRNREYKNVSAYNNYQNHYRQSPQSKGTPQGSAPLSSLTSSLSGMTNLSNHSASMNHRASISSHTQIEPSYYQRGNEKNENHVEFGFENTNLNDKKRKLQEQMINRPITPLNSTPDLLVEQQREIRVIVNLLHTLIQDAAYHMSQFHTFNKSLRKAIYNGFIHFAQNRKLEISEFDDYVVFWSHFEKKSSPYIDFLNEFMELFSFKLAVLYMLKIRFITVLGQHSSISVAEKDLLNPSFFLTQVFRKSSSSEMQFEAFEQNCFSWFRPSPKNISVINKAIPVFKKMCFTSLILIIKQGPQALFSSKPIESTEPSLRENLWDKKYGLFLDLILDDYSKWNKEEVKKVVTPDQYRPFNFFQSHVEEDHPIKPLITKFAGDNIEKLSYAFWAAYENSPNRIRPDLICPEFISSNKEHCLFIHLCHSINFLTSLVIQAKAQSIPPVQYIAQATQRRTLQLRLAKEEQINLFSPQADSPIHPQDTIQAAAGCYDRIVLQLTNFPKNNSHFYLVNQIQSQIGELRRKGQIILLTTKRLFVPSQSDKVQHLLTNLDFKASYNLDNLRDKGAIPSFAYIFELKDIKKNATLLTQKAPPASHFFTLQGTLESPQQFSTLIDSVKKFFKSKSKDTTPLYQQDIERDLSFEYYQDLVLEGRPLNSSSGIDHSQAHAFSQSQSSSQFQSPHHQSLQSNQSQSQSGQPGFFKNLAKSCAPLSYFFGIEQLEMHVIDNEIDLVQSCAFSGNFWTQKEHIRSSFPYFILLDFRNPKQPYLDIFPTEILKSKVNELGVALCFYFGIFPKFPQTNIQSIREYFQCELGHQVLSLFFSSGTSKLKVKLNSLLIPKFFAGTPEQHNTPPSVQDFETKINNYPHHQFSSPGQQQNNFPAHHYGEKINTTNTFRSPINPLNDQESYQFPPLTLGLLNWNYETILKKSVGEINSSLQTVEARLKALIQMNPSALFNAVSYFKVQIHKAILYLNNQLTPNNSGHQNSNQEVENTPNLNLQKEVRENKQQLQQSLGQLRHNDPHLVFMSPVFINSIMSKKLQAIYPRNQDFFVEIKCHSPQELHSPFTGCVLKSYQDFNHEKGEEFYLEFQSHNKVILNLYSHKESLLFVQFLLKSTSMIPVSQILQQIKLPQHSDLLECFEKFQTLRTTLLNLYEKSAFFIDQILKSHLSHQNT